jgi:NAD(P)H-hydrate epimerase
MSDYKLPKFEKNSHKGEKGKVMIVGGSYKYYGAPIFTALAAENSGADLITLFLPNKHIEVAKNYSLNLFLHAFVQSDLGLKDTGLIIDESTRNHVMVIGNGLGIDADTIRAIVMILKEVKIPCVIDAEALVPEILEIKDKSHWVITPHKGEFQRVFGLEASKDNVVRMAKEHGMTILVKGAVDFIASLDGQLVANETGCPQMRVGGTGDALAGIVASYIAQGLTNFDAAKSATYYFGKVGEIVSEKDNITAQKLIRNYPKMLKKIS